MGESYTFTGLIDTNQLQLVLDDNINALKNMEILFKTMKDYEKLKHKAKFKKRHKSKLCIL